jgi:hypothetical protein
MWFDVCYVHCGPPENLPIQEVLSDTQETYSTSEAESMDIESIFAPGYR